MRGSWVEKMPAKFSTILHFWYSATPLQISFWNEMYWLISQAEFCETPCYIPLSFDNIIFFKLYFQLPPKLSSVLFLFPFLVTSFSDNIWHSVSESFVKSQYHINKSSFKKVNFVNLNVSDFFFLAFMACFLDFFSQWLISVWFI